jgi:gas vesicle protein
MGSFTNGLLVGIGISLLFAPRKGEETRNLLMERIKTLRGSSAQTEETAPSTQAKVTPLQPVQDVVPVVSPIEAAPADSPSSTTDISSAQSDLSSSQKLPPVDVLPPLPEDPSPTQPLRRPQQRP